MKITKTFWVVYNHSHDYYLSKITGENRVTKDIQNAYLFPRESAAYLYRKTPSWRVYRVELKIVKVFHYNNPINIIGL